MLHFDLRLPTRHRELNRLICRAMSNPMFARALITTPDTALATDEHQLSADEVALVRSIRAADIHDFAEQLYSKVAADAAHRTPQRQYLEGL
ncbi:hypothetical protein HC891_17160 [Candidatus Gracilibacteria bacterium]|nr:hypothetical protein [Candidatus Gracilibacteria bacterium]